MGAVEVALSRLEGRVDLMVLPESVAVGALRLDGSVSPERPASAQVDRAQWQQTIGQVLAGRPVVLVLGTDTIEGGHVYNSMVAWTADGLAGWYHKRLLVPLAEYRPWLLGRFLAGARQYSAGQGSRVIGADSLHLGCFICQEVLSPGLIRRSVRDGATVLVSGGNDGVFADPAVPSIHADLARLRAVESGRYLVRAMKSGRSAIIDPAGRELARSDSSDPTVLLATIEPLRQRTLYVRFGDWVLGVAVLGVAGCLVAVRRSFLDRG
jgi:apolipoprotein N-acyltransferase